MPEMVDRFRFVAPICVDVLGESWVGYATSGAEAGRPVILTLCEHRPDSLIGSLVVEAAGGALNLRHPNVLAFLDVARGESSFALVSEHMGGEPLSNLLREAAAQRSPLSEAVALAIMREAIESLSSINYSHPDLVSHGGLCPDVVFVTDYGEAMLRQPGVVGAALKFPGFRRHPSALPYQAPEYLRDDRENQETVDVFSAGVILWELLAGRPLFGAKDHKIFGRLSSMSPEERAQVEYRIASTKIPSLSSVRRSGPPLHPDTILLVEWALHRDPGLRPASLADLSRAIASLPGSVLATHAEVATVVRQLAGSAMIQRAQLIAKDLSERESAVVEAARRLPAPIALDLDAPGVEELGVEPVRRANVAHAQAPMAPPALSQKVVSEGRGSEVVVAFRRPAGRRTGPVVWLLAAAALFAAGGFSSYALFAPDSDATRSSDLSVTGEAAIGAVAAPMPSAVAQPEARPAGAPPPDVEADADNEPTVDTLSDAPQTQTDVKKKSPRRPVHPAKPPVEDAPYRPSGI